MRIEHIIKPTILGLVVPALILFLFASSSAFAFVSGRCDVCHTMHNSEENNIVAEKTVGGSIVPSPEAINSLLVSDCVTCHTNPSNTDPTYSFNGNTVPVVFTTGNPTVVTAGGNFFYTTAGGGGDNYGHNVRGIVGQDGSLGRAPGAGSIGCAGSCHDSLAFTDAATTPTDGTNIQTNGCQGCHLKTGHHSRNSGTEGGVADEAGDAFRFLSGHDPGIVGIVDNGQGVYEDPDWEIDYPGGADHNLYLAQANNPEKHPYISIGRWCAGCHADFHAYGEVEELTGLSGGGDRNALSVTSPSPLANNPWLRHPTNVRFPTDGDFSWADGLTVGYDPAMPVARGTPARDAPIAGDDQVMCLSCHKAHASQYPNSLRFDYDANIAHTFAGNDGETLVGGCFFCHRTKDDL